MTPVWTRFGGPRGAARARGVLYALGAIAFVAIYVKSVQGTLDKNDGYDFYVAGRALLEGRDPRAAMLAEIGYITYPPSHAMLFAPLTAFGHVGFALLWNGINAACVLVVPALALGTITGRVRGHPLWWYLLPALVSLRTLETNATLGQSNLVVGTCCMVGIYLVRHGRPVRAGLAIAIGAAIKITPGLFGVYFLWRRRWLAAGGSLLGAVLLFGVGPVIAYGPRNVVPQYETWRFWAGHLVNPPAHQYHYAHGQSVKSAMLRLLTESNARKPEKGPFYVNVLALDREQVKRVAPLISAVVFVTLLAVCRNPTARPDTPGPYLEMGLVLVAMLLMSPYVRKAHYASLYPAVSLAVAALLHGGLPARSARWLKRGLIAFAVVLNLTAPAIITKQGSEFFNGICIFLWATLVFATPLAAVCVACRRAGAPAVAAEA